LRMMSVYGKIRNRCFVPNVIIQKRAASSQIANATSANLLLTLRYMLSKSAIRENKLVISITLFLCFFYAIHSFKPRFIYNEHGGFRQFGIGYKQKTVVPIWIASIVLAILCYVAVYYMSV
jgi:hypothetical protein